MGLPRDLSETPSLGQIQNKSLREHVLEMLRNAIVNGELKPGQTLIVAELATQLGVSRAPLREAINMLSAEGLVEMVPYHGTKVTKLARKDIEDLYSVRSLMEGFSVQQVIALGRTKDVVAQLRAICAEMIQAADEGNLIEVNKIDRQFHDTLVTASQNDLLMMLWGVVSLRVRQVMSLRNQKKGNLREIASNHLQIVDAIESENTELAVQLIHHHIGATGDVIAEAWDEDTQESANPIRSKEKQTS
jgi:DNA-binding GntR family transcriptional regulator